MKKKIHSSNSISFKILIWEERGEIREERLNGGR